MSTQLDRVYIKCVYYTLSEFDFVLKLFMIMLRLHYIYLFNKTWHIEAFTMKLNHEVNKKKILFMLLRFDKSALLSSEGVSVIFCCIELLMPSKSVPSLLIDLNNNNLFPIITLFRLSYLYKWHVLLAYLCFKLQLLSN